MILYLNGQFIDEEKAAISPADRGFTLGDGVFDTLLIENAEIINGADHFKRLQSHAKILDLVCPLSLTGWLHAIQILIQQNETQQGRYALRTTLTRGPAARGLLPAQDTNPTLLLRLAPAPDIATLPPLHAIIAQSVRRNEHSPLSRIKSLNYADNILALMEAQKNGVPEAIMLNTAGNVTCASAANIFIEIDGKTLTPHLRDGALNGIARQKILDTGLAEA